MTSLGEELLATKTIPELRQLVSSLAEDGTSKRRELQQMVGSKYQDFLQSADMVSGMRGRADLVESELHSFWTAKTELELLTREFLEQAMKGISGAGVITEHGLSDTASKMQQSNSENKADSSDSRFKRRRNFVDGKSTSHFTVYCTVNTVHTREVLGNYSSHNYFGLLWMGREFSKQLLALEQFTSHLISILIVSYLFCSERCRGLG